MIKQRYVRYEAVNKEGEVVATGFDVGGKIYGFRWNVPANSLNIASTSGFMRWYGSTGDLQRWKDFVNCKKDCKFRKAIVFVG